MKFRKRPVEIEANKFFSRSLNHPAGVKSDEQGYYIDTLEGRMTVKDGDWIITEVKGEHYPCKPDIFELTYEKVSEPQSIARFACGLQLEDDEA